MTRQKHLKALVRERMTKTGERYAAARRHVVAGHQPPVAGAGVGAPHLPGSIPLATALRVLLAHAGVTLPSGRPPSEALVFGATGGIGAGTFAFRYDEFSSFYVAGRHLWYDDVACLTAACRRFGLAPAIKEFGGAGTAEKELAAWTRERPVIAWVDMGNLPHRGMPPSWSGGGYHLVTVYQAEPGGEALIGDLADRPVALPTHALTLARGRIKKDKYRILAIPKPVNAPDFGAALADGLNAGALGLITGRIRNFSIASFGVWADQLHGTKVKESWEKIFPPGPRLWRGLTSIHEFVEHFGTGGGLMRPLFAETLREAAVLLDRPDLETVADDYAALGAQWSELADAALPAGVPAFDEARRLLARKAELIYSGADGAQDAAQVWQAIEALGEHSNQEFPLSEADADTLRRELKERVRVIHAEELRLARLR